MPAPYLAAVKLSSGNPRGQWSSPGDVINVGEPVLLVTHLSWPGALFQGPRDPSSRVLWSAQTSPWRMRGELRYGSGRGTLGAQ